MRTIEEIVASIKDATYTTASGPILDLFRELVKDGRLEDAASALNIWVQQVPQSERFIRASTPAIVLNHFIGLQNGLTWDQIVDWSIANQHWGKEIAEHAFDEKTLRPTVDALIESIRQFRP